jgi:hypothetical protein
VASGNRIGGLRSHLPHRPLQEAMFNLSGYQRQIQLSLIAGQTTHPLGQRPLWQM